MYCHGKRLASIAIPLSSSRGNRSQRYSLINPHIAVQRKIRPLSQWIPGIEMQ